MECQGTDGDRSGSPSPLRWLSAAGTAALAGAALLWLTQTVPVLHLGFSVLVVVECWLIMTGFGALRTAAITPRYRAENAVLAIGLALHAIPLGPRTRYDSLVSRKSVYLLCGYAAASIATVALGADTLLAVGAIRLSGVNLVLTSLLLPGLTSECATVRVVGPQAAAADLALRQAERAATAGRASGSRALRVLRGGARPDRAS